MSNTVFYSWQSDTPVKVNRSFIRDALDTAIKRIGHANSLEDADRPDVELDHDTKGVAGSPELVNTILDKIDRCAVFVPDVTFVAKAMDGSLVSNPNVLIELGYAAKTIGFDRFVMVMNDAFGAPEDHLPFDLRHRRFPVTYTLPPDANQDQRSETRKQLVATLEEAIGLILANLDSDGSDRSRFAEPIYLSSSFLEDGAVVAEITDEDEGDGEVYWQNGPQSFLRLQPSQISAARNPHQLRRMLNVHPYLSMLGRVSGGHMEANRFGAVIFNASQEGLVRTLSQAFSSGEIWGLESLPIEHKRVRGLALPYLYERFTQTLNSYMNFAMTHLHQKPPFRVVLGVSDVENYGLIGDFGRTYGKCFQKELIKIAEITPDDIDELVTAFLQEISLTCGAA